MVGPQNRLRLSRSVIAHPAHALVALHAAWERPGARHFNGAVVVNIRGIEPAEGVDRSRNAGGAGKGRVGKLPLRRNQNVGHRRRRGLGGHRRGDAGDEHRRQPVPQRSGNHPALVQLRHGDGEPGGGHILQVSAVLPVVVIRRALALFVGVKDHQLLEPVAVQVYAGVADIADAAQQLLKPPGGQGVNRQGLKLRADPPAHNQLRPPVAVQVAVDHAVDRRAAALDDGGLLIAVLLGGEDIDFQGLFILRLAEEGQGLLLPVAVQVRQLHGLDVGPGRGGGVLRAVLQNRVEPGVQLRVFGGQLREGVKLLGVELDMKAAAAAEDQGQRQRRRQGPDFLHHYAASLAV